MNRKNLISYAVHDATHCATCASEASRKIMRGTSKTKMELGRKKTTSACKVEDATRSLVRSKLCNLLMRERELLYAKAWKRARGLEKAIFSSHRYDPEGYIALYKTVCKAHRLAPKEDEELDSVRTGALPAICAERVESLAEGGVRTSDAEPEGTQKKKSASEIVREIVEWRGGLGDEIECPTVCYKCLSRTRLRRKREGLAEDGSDDPEPMPNGDVVYSMAWTRSRDEPARIFYRCRKCGNNWSQ